MRNFFLYLKTDMFRRNLIIAILFVIVLVVGVFFGLRSYTRHGETRPVPELEGMVIEDAVRLLQSQSFHYALDSVYQMDQTPGLVIDQNPVAGTPVKKERTLYLTIITRTAPETPFPELIEKTFIEAQAMLSSFGLKLGDTSYTADIARDVVLETNFGGQPIQPGRMIPKGSSVDLVLGDGRGESEVPIPDLTGLTLQEVRFALRGASLNLGTIRYGASVTDSSTAVVVQQDPALDEALIRIGSPIHITLSNIQ